MGERDFQRLLFDYGRRCRERGADAPYDFIGHELGPRSFTAVADRDRLARRGLFNSGAWHLTAEGHQLAEGLKNRDVAVFAAYVRKPRQGFSKPAGIAQHRLTTAPTPPVKAAARTAAFSQRSVTKDEATRPISMSSSSLESRASVTCAGTHSVASGDSRSDFSPEAVMSLASAMSPSPSSV